MRAEPCGHEFNFTRRDSQFPASSEFDPAHRMTVVSSRFVPSSSLSGQTRPCRTRAPASRTAASPGHFERVIIRRQTSASASMGVAGYPVGGAIERVSRVVDRAIRQPVRKIVHVGANIAQSLAGHAPVSK